MLQTSDIGASGAAGIVEAGTMVAETQTRA
jgi:hypothetical protein